MSKTDGLFLTQCGQSAPYQDSVFAGTVVAESESAARERLAKMRSVTEILNRQSEEKWSSPYFTEFREVEPGKWKFRIVEEYTG